MVLIWPDCCFWVWVDWCYLWLSLAGCCLVFSVCILYLGEDIDLWLVFLVGLVSFMCLPWDWVSVLVLCLVFAFFDLLVCVVMMFVFCRFDC